MFKKVMPYLFLLVAFNISLYAGTGGDEVASWYTNLSSALEGYWGKLGAVAFIVMALLALKQGGIVPGAFLFFLGISIGTIPSMIDARYTLLF
jgi:energy-converting hydrogenase Eha subunit B